MSSRARINMVGVIWTCIIASALSHSHSASSCISVGTVSNLQRIKMRAVTIILLFACVFAMAYGDLVCGTNFCKQNPCTGSVAKTSCRTPSVYRANHAGKCACCPACVTLLNEGAACKAYSKELGETPSAVCREPLTCLRGVCTNAPLRV